MSETPDVWFYFLRMLQGVLQTIWIGGVGTAVALVLGALLAVVRLRGPRVFSWLVSAYVELIRGTPAIIQLFVLFFGLTQFGIYFTPAAAGVIWLSLYGAAYACEIFRAGIAEVHPGQEEAARALSVGPVRTFVSIVLPQAIVNILPPLTTFLVIQLKTTTILYIIGVQEVIAAARLGSNSLHQPLLMYGLAALIFIVMNVALSRTVTRINNRSAAWAH